MLLTGEGVLLQVDEKRKDSLLLLLLWWLEVELAHVEGARAGLASWSSSFGSSYLPDHQHYLLIVVRIHD